VTGANEAAVDDINGGFTDKNSLNVKGELFSTAARLAG
jgi:hypothetical protein